MQRKLYELLASLINARQNCIDRNNIEWRDTHEDSIIKLVERIMPSGAGFDNGTKIDFDRSTDSRLEFTTAFHHMNDGGYYDGWTEHRVIITPSFIGGYDIRVTGRNRNDIKDYIAETFCHCLDVIDQSEKLHPTPTAAQDTAAQHAAYDAEFGENDSNGTA